MIDCIGDLNSILSYYTSGTFLMGLGFALMIGELIFTEMFLLWIGASFLFTGAVVYSLSCSVMWTTFIFSCFSILSLWIGRKYYEIKNKRLVYHTLNDRSLTIVGKSFILKKDPDLKDPLMGIIMIEGTRWMAKSNTILDDESLVNVTDVQGNILIIEKA